MGSIATFQTDVVDACSNPAYVWAVGAQKLALAIDTFIKSAVITTSISGIWTSPVGASSAIVSSGTGVLTIAGTAALQSGIVNAYANPVWAGIGTIIANAINAYIPTGSIATSDGPVYTGTGSGALILPPTAAVFVNNMELLYSNPANSWAGIGSQMCSLITAYFVTITCLTIDVGAVPPAGWIGTGVTTFTWS